MNDGPTHDGSPAFKLSDLEYSLPEELIAQKPLPQRDASRMLNIDRADGQINDAVIADLPEVLQPGDLLVLNDTKVLPAKFIARRRTGGKVRGLFVAEERPGIWRVMLEGSRRLRAGEALSVAATPGEEVTLTLEQSYAEGHWRVGVDASGTVEEVLERIGQAPLPPYIHRGSDGPAVDLDDRSRYQTVYARRPGAIAAPTAGLHLTQTLLDQICARGVEITLVTLHVGVGTFRPISAELVSQHVMHAEWYELSPATADAVRACRERGGRVVAVGTTAVRTLESAATEHSGDRLVQPGSGATELFIYPPRRFRVVDALLTNFHLPRSTLLALVMAFAGIEHIRRAYRHAIERRYRFYSYGDAMFIH
jgi:S-adenosylmethionine:tRNA ribosyltransferase-isomerase